MGQLRIASRSGEPFLSRTDAGVKLAQELLTCRDQNCVVLGILRGGLIVASEVAIALEADFDIVLACKLGAPDNRELAIGAIVENGRVVMDESLAAMVGATESYIKHQRSCALAEIERRASLFRSILPKLPLKDRPVIVVDDGVATGATMHASLMALRDEHPSKLTAALPVGPEDTIDRLIEYADELIFLRVPRSFQAVGQFYLQFDQVEDDAIVKILEKEAERRCSK